jgi:hypothetical protein
VEADRRPHAPPIRLLAAPDDVLQPSFENICSKRLSSGAKSANTVGGKEGPVMERFLIEEIAESIRNFAALGRWLCGLIEPL